MEINKDNNQKCLSVRFSVKEEIQEIGHAYLYLIYNDLHNKPYGLLEDIYVDEKSRSKGVGTVLLKKIIEEAKDKECYKLIATSREERKEIHKWYEKNGFQKYGFEFRMNF